MVSRGSNISHDKNLQIGLDLLEGGNFALHHLGRMRVGLVGQSRGVCRE